jgi:GTP-binding protein HflX
VDCSNPRFEEQIEQVETILEELDLGEKPRLLIFNKSDLLSQLKKSDPLTFMKVRQLSRRLQAISISAADRKSLEPLIEELQRRFWPDEITHL